MGYEENRVDLNVLYVEDDELSRSGIFSALKRKVRQIDFAANGREGLEVFKQKRPDVVITDIKMPLLNGLEMAKKILEIEPTAEIMIATAFEDAELFRQAIDIGVDKYLTKPLEVAQILAHLKRIEARKDLERRCEVGYRVLDEVARLFWFDLELNCIRSNQKAQEKGLEITKEELGEMARLALESERGICPQEGRVLSVCFNLAKEARGFFLCVLGERA